MLKRDIKTHQVSNGKKKISSPNLPCVSQLMYPSVATGKIQNSVEVFLKFSIL